MKEEGQNISGEKKKRGNFIIFLIIKAFRLLYKTAFYLILFVVLLSLALVVFGQFRVFRSWMANYALSYVNKELTAEVSVSDLWINPFRGIEIKDALLYTAGDTLAYIPEVIIDADFSALLDNKIILNRVELKSPLVKLLRSRTDSTWNTEHIAPPGKDTTKGTTPDLHFDISKFRLTNGRFIRLDSTIRHYSLSHINYANLNLKDINLFLSGKGSLKAYDFFVNISKLSFKDRHYGVNLKDFELTAAVDTNHADISKLKVRTNGVSLDLSLSALGMNVFDGVDLAEIKNSEIQVGLDADKITPYEIRMLSGLKSNYSKNIKLTLNAGMKGRELELKKLNLETGSTSIDAEGRINNIFDFDKADYDIAVDDSRIILPDIKNMLPAGILNGIPDFYTAGIKSLVVHGGPDFANIDADISSSLGSIKGHTDINWSGVLSYKGRIVTKSVNLGRITGDKQLTSSINADLDFSGSGTDLKTLNAGIKLKSQNTVFAGYAYRNLYLLADFKKSVLKVDTLKIELPSSAYFNENEYIYRNPFIELAGTFDIKNPRMPVYDLTTKFRGLNLLYITGSPAAPKQFSGRIDLNGSGIRPDSISGRLNTEITDLVFGDRAFMPFNIDISLDREPGMRTIDLKSTFMDLLLKGNYNISNLVSLIEKQGNHLADFMGEKIKALDFDKKADTLLTKSETKLGRFVPFNFELNARINDFTPVTMFMKNTKLISRANVGISLDVTRKSSRLTIDSVNLAYFIFEGGGTEVLLQPTMITGGIDFELIDSVINISNLGVSLKTLSDMKINGTKFSNPYAMLNLHGDILSYSLSSTYENDIFFKTAGDLEIINNGVNLKIDTLNIVYKKILDWNNPIPVLARISSAGFQLDTLNLKRKNGEVITASGKFNNDKAEKINLSVSDFSLDGYTGLMNEQMRNSLQNIEGKIENLNIFVNGSLDNPDIDMNIKTSDLLINKYKIGYLSGMLYHRDSVIKGNIGITSRNGDSLNSFHEYLSVDVNSFPLNLSLKNVRERFHKGAEVNVSVYTDKMPLELAGPFVSKYAQKLSGTMDLEFNVIGYLPDKLNYSGKIITNNAGFLSYINNIYYMLNTDIKINTGRIDINDITLSNIDRDLKHGRAKINGDVELKGLDIKDIDLTLSSPGIKLLSNASVRNMPDLYGDLVISTGGSGIRFITDLESASLKGGINVDKARLYLPGSSSQEATNSKIEYERVSDNVTRVSVRTQKKKTDSIPAEPEITNRKRKLTDNMMIDINVKLKNAISVDMDFAVLGKLVADITTPNPNEGLHYYQERSPGDAKLFGELELKKGSKLKFIKLFDTQGTISFPTGRIDNPMLDLKAEYKGYTYMNNTRKDYIVYLHITGTKENPELTFTYSFDGVEATGDQTAIKENAMLLLILGMTKDQLNQPGATGGGAVKDILGSSSSAVISSALSNIISGTVIKNAELDISENWEDTKLQLSGEFVGLNWSVGGSVADIMNNNEIIIEIPLNLFNDSNIKAAIQGSMNTSTVQTSNFDQKNWEIKFLFKKSF